MKVKKRFMIALAGAMILGVFGISSAPMMADDMQYSGFVLTIPAELPIQDARAGLNKVGELIYYEPQTYPRRLTVSTDNESGYKRYLVNEYDKTQKIPYDLCIGVRDDSSSEPVILNQNGVKLPPISGPATVVLDIFVELTEDFDPDGMLPGVYTNPVVFTAAYETTA